MEHIALYRLFRPMTFDEIVEQDGPVSSLRQAVKTGRIGHAYLFSGQRGTGKTSIAKVFSRAVNCENPVNGNPCNKCAICKGIIDGSLMDVIEIDAASNNSVENIRRICEEVVFAPSKAKKKVYIIDEVHMLSQGAFNALLKTLEEPPAHVLFLQRSFPDASALSSRGSPSTASLSACALSATERALRLKMMH